MSRKPIFLLLIDALWVPWSEDITLLGYFQKTNNKMSYSFLH
jgi:hypothetical protein